MNNGIMWSPEKRLSGKSCAQWEGRIISSSAQAQANRGDRANGLTQKNALPVAARSIADNLKKAGWSLGWVSAVDSEGRTIWIADAHRDDGKRFVVRADEKLTAFLELEGAICVCRWLKNKSLLA